MSPSRAAHRGLVLAPVLAGAAALAVAAAWPALSPRGPFAELGWLAGLTFVALGAAAYRPGGGWSLGLGALAVPPTAVYCGPGPAVWVAALAVLLRDGIGQIAARRGGAGGSERRGLPSSFAAAGGTALAALAGTLAGGRWGGLAASPLVAGGLGVAAFLGVEVAYSLGVERRLSAPRPTAGLLAPLGLDAVGWGTGVALAANAEAGAGVTAVLAAVLAALAAEAGRNRWLLEASRRRLSGLDRLRGAGRRMVADGREILAVVERLRAECSNVVPVAWFRFGLVAAGVEPQSWWAGPDGRLAPGEPAPPAYPEARPGFHRRSRWRVLERELSAQGQTVARLTLWCDPRLLEAEDVRLLEGLLPQMTASVQRSLLDREAKEDPLTGVAVRRVLERRLHEAFDLACEEGGSVAVILCDVDHFKRINDTHGHAAGDLALQAVARALDGHRRETDLLARYGGEEFTLLLDRTDGETAMRVAERLRRAVAALTVEAEGALVPLTVSAGVACFPEVHVKSAGELLLLADGALYEAKRQGRDLCLLDLGQARYRDAAGNLYQAADRPPSPEAPQVFA